MTMEIFWLSGSPYSWRALLAAAVKQASYQSRLLDYSRGDLNTPEFRALNPRGKVPVLRDGEFVLCESLAILAYLDCKSTEPPLFGRNAAETGRVWNAISEWTYYGEPNFDRIGRHILFGNGTAPTEAEHQAVRLLQDELKRMQGVLSARPWLAGDSISAADIVVYPFLALLQRVAAKEAARPLDLAVLPLESQYPALAAWCGRIQALPDYAATYPPHWRATDAMPTAAAS